MSQDQSPFSRRHALRRPLQLRRFAWRMVPVACALAFSMPAAAHAQTTPPLSTPVLTLSALLDRVAAQYPTLLAARLEVDAATQDMTAAERRAWPTLSAVVESDANGSRAVPSRGIQAEHILWDAGASAARIEEARQSQQISQTRLLLQQQDLFLQVSTAWQSALGARERLHVALDTLERFRQFQLQMQRRVDADAAPRIDLELINARMLQTEVELGAARSALALAVSRLEQLSGEADLLERMDTAPPLLPAYGVAPFQQLLAQTDWEQVVNSSALLAKARGEVALARNRIAAKKAEGFPQWYVRVYQPVGAIPGNEDTRLSSFVGLRYSPGAGFASFAETQALATRMASTEQSVEASRREALQVLRSDREEFQQTLSRMGTLEKSVAGSASVLESYQRQFLAGRKSWQDLLNAVRECAQSRYALVDAKAALLGAMQRLQIRMGQQPA